ncbi:MAG: hypothetical protein C0442_10105 [Chlorobiaceae bacterium]|nr:hypothetical protein [Chlorobiaceae bacterium]
MNKLIFLLLLATSLTFSQFDENRRDNRLLPNVIDLGFLSDVHLIDNGAQLNLYYIFKISYTRLLFHKSGDVFEANFEVATEISDSLNNFITRESVREKIFVSSFEETNNDKNYVTGLIKLYVPFLKRFIINTKIVDLTTNIERRLIPKNVRGFEKNDKVLKPFFVSDIKNKNDMNEFHIVSYGNRIPLTSESYTMLIPIADTSIDKLDIVIGDNKDSLELSSEEFFDASLKLTDTGNKIILTKDSNKVYRNFIFRKFNFNLDEGPKIINVKNFPTKTFRTEVFWFNKPKSLFNIRHAVNILNAVESKDTVKNIISADEFEMLNNLIAYWKKFDPTPNTSYNEVKNEFYQRADYAEDNFSTLTKRDGAETDRGKIFLRFGQPTEITRASTREGFMTETWFFQNHNRKFIFIDRAGTGKYEIVN